LHVVNVRKINFPKKAFRLDKDMAHISSYLLFDGHIYETLRGLMFSSKTLKDLKVVEKIFKRKFNLEGIYHLNSAGSHFQTHKFYVFNKPIATTLLKLGIPKGNKTMQNYRVPSWINNSKELSREFLKIAFLCEGSFKEKNRKNARISINIAKLEKFLESGIEFMNDLKSMLMKFGINTTDCYIMGENKIRKMDGERTKNIRFRIITADNHKFIKEIGWIK